MDDFLLISFLEFGIISFVCVSLLAPRGFRNHVLLRQNRNLKWCLTARRWVTPLTFATNSAFAAWYHVVSGAYDVAWQSNLAVLSVTIVVGPVLTQIIVCHLKTVNLNRKIPSL